MCIECMSEMTEWYIENLFWCVFIILSFLSICFLRFSLILQKQNTSPSANIQKNLDFVKSPKGCNIWGPFKELNYLKRRSVSGW